MKGIITPSYALCLRKDACLRETHGLILQTHDTAQRKLYEEDNFRLHNSQYEGTVPL